MELQIKIKISEFKDEEITQEFTRVETTAPMTKEEYPITVDGKIFDNRAKAIEYIINFLKQNL